MRSDNAARMRREQPTTFYRHSLVVWFYIDCTHVGSATASFED